MKSTAKWVKNFQSVVDNDRNHAIVTDLPAGKNGDDMGATALEVTVMAFSGCVSTIYAVVAKKMRLTFSELEVETKAEKGDKDPTITKLNFVVKVKSEASEEKLKKCLELTLDTCPVGILYKNAGVQIDYTLEAL